jgi:SAM-dependent methyltransferase
VLELPPGGSVLDVGCGTGRHSIELASRGFTTTGLDLSSEMLAQAAAAAEAAGVHVEWLHLDATCFSLQRSYDAAICLCEGSFGLLGKSDDPIEQPLAILRNIVASLRPGGAALLTVLNAAKMLRSYQNEDVAAGRFDPFALVETNALPPREGMPPVEVRERAFVGTELILLCARTRRVRDHAGRPQARVRACTSGWRAPGPTNPLFRSADPTSPQRRSLHSKSPFLGAAVWTRIL